MTLSESLCVLQGFREPHARPPMYCLRFIGSYVKCAVELTYPTGAAPPLLLLMERVPNSKTQTTWEGTPRLLQS
jgi:hypothetical protein